MRNSSSLDWLRFMHTPNDYRVSHKHSFVRPVWANKKRYHDSRRSTVTTQTQNKTRQNYYAIFPVYAGEA